MKIKKSIIISIMIGLAFNIIYIILGLKRQHYFDLSLYEGYSLDCPWSVYNIFILCNTDTSIIRIYIYTIPFISSLSCWSIFDDRIHISNLFKSFFTGCIVTFLSLIIGLLLTFFFFPAIKPEITTGLFPLGFRGSPLNELYLKLPVIYILVISFVYVLYSGLYAIMAYSFYFIFKNKAVVSVFILLFNIGLTRFIIYMKFDVSTPDTLLIPNEFFLNIGIIDYLKYFCFLISIIIIVILSEVILIIKENKVDKKKI